MVCFQTVKYQVRVVVWVFKVMVTPVAYIGGIGRPCNKCCILRQWLLTVSPNFIDSLVVMVKLVPQSSAGGGGVLGEVAEG